MITTLRRHWLAVLALSLLAGGCAQPTNPSFPVTVQDARKDLARMKQEPVQLRRPLVIIGGLADPLLNAPLVACQFDSLAMNDGIVEVSLGECPTFDMCRDKVIAAVEKVYPSGEPGRTVEVDVVGMSMGGVVARYAALPRNDGKRLRIARLFTISSPLNGAQEANWTPAFFPVIRGMRTGSDFLTALNAREPEYPVFSYVRLHDFPVGPEHAALPGRVAWWVSPPLPFMAHNGAFYDARIIADIARRLRDEKPLTTSPPAPLPS
jgi:hypothetical protein